MDEAYQIEMGEVPKEDKIIQIATTIANGESYPRIIALTGSGKIYHWDIENKEKGDPGWLRVPPIK